MAPSRRLSNGRSPLVNQQRQITSFFVKRTSSSSPSPSPSPSSAHSKLCTKLNPNPNPDLCRNRSPSPSPTTPSPHQPKPKKPLLVIGQSPSPPATTPSARVYGNEVIGRRIRVYWPLDKAWYNGYLDSFDKGSGKHLVQYDDGEEESLDLANENIEWVEESTKRYKRLRRMDSLAIRKVVIDEDDEADKVAEECENGGDDTSDDDWKKDVEKEPSEDTEEEHVDLEEEKEDEDESQILATKQETKNGPRKRKAMGVTLEVATKDKSSRVASNSELIVSEVRPIRNTDSEKPCAVTSSALAGDSAERFGKREEEKLSFLSPGRRRDANRRRPGDLNYDSRTLHLPPEFLKNLSGGQRQWWEFKAKHMDKVVFFKMGKFYELFEMDAHVGTKELDLQYMRGDQPHCGFPEKNFSMNVEKLARKGYRVLVVEQTETPEQLELRRKEKGAKDKVVRREICAVVSKGTLTEGELLSANPDPSYIMAVAESPQDTESEDEHRIFGICAVDAATSRIILGQFQDDSECNSLCTLLAELRPVEIIKPAKMLSPQTEKAILRHTRDPVVNELVPTAEFWDAEKTLNEVRKIYNCINDFTGSSAVVGKSKGSGILPAVLSRLLIAGDDGRQALSALGGTLYYLKQAFLDETLLRFGKFEELPCSGFHSIATKSYMVLDAAALENLEIFENTRNGGYTGTLYAQLNHCVTAFGKRLLKAWLARPLYNIGLLKERQDAVGCLRAEYLSYALDFRKALCRLPDMERLLARIFSGSEASGRNSNKVVLYEDAAKKQLQEFISALRGCESMSQACSSFGVILDNMQSTKLRHLLSIGQGLPDVNPFLKHFKDGFDWDDANRSGRIIPHVGVDREYDSACEKVKEIEFSLTKHLKEQRKILGDSSIAYVTVGKEAYLLEVPECLRGSIPQDFELRSSKKGFFRYWTPHIKKLLGELSQAESEKEAALKSILRRMIRRYCEHHEKWSQLVSTIAELDVLISLAIASDYYEGPTCRPAIISSSTPCFSAKGLGHPILRSDSLGKGAFVPNDITIGGSGDAGFILLTGPNMGGKSTLLRQVCLAAILAQVGADVPAESFELSPVDRIFVRMGAKDHIMAGQSTFLTELSETASMLSSATRDSLVALDELGRGTSTSDGQAIAEAVLNHFVNKIQCRGMFSTHYHRLAIDYQDDSKVALCHMECQVGNCAKGIEDVTFLYRLASGACPKSYGVNVARLAGFPDSLLKTAATKSREFEGAYGRNRTHSGKMLTRQEDAAGMIAFVRKVLSIRADMNFSNSSLSGDASPLTELQHRVRILLQQH